MVLGQGRRRVPVQNVEQDSSGEDVQSIASNRISDGEETPQEHRDELEPFVEWIQRVTHNAEERLKLLNIRNWVEEARLKKWKWARNLYMQKSPEKWSTRALHWNPQIHYDRPKPTARRRPTRPNLRWLDDITKVARELPDAGFGEVLRQANFWNQHQDLYVRRV